MTFTERGHPLSTAELATRTIAIVGAGFTGTLVATNLLQLAHERPLTILLLDRTQIGAGLAYARRPYPYLLNVPAGRMSARSADPLDFLAFARRERPEATPQDFLPRELYAQYLKWNLACAQSAAPSHVRLAQVRGSAIALERTPLAFRIRLADGRTLVAETVVLALGNPPPARMRVAEGLRGSSRYVEDPWACASEFQPGETILIAGTGPTMADTALAGIASTGGRVIIHAISRHGLLPAPQTQFRTVEDADASARLREAGSSIAQLLRTVRTLSEEAARRGGDWREVIALVRALAPTLWQRLSDYERRRFLRHIRSYWDVHRHRLPPTICSSLEELRGKGTLYVHAGRLMAMQVAGKRLRVRWRARGEARERVLLVDRVINCTGPAYDVRHGRERLVRSLIVRGMAAPDPLGLGLLTGEYGALRGADGHAVTNLYYVGPLLRADHWETTAVQELRGHVERLARHLAATGALSVKPAETASVASEDDRAAGISPSTANHSV